MNHDLICSWLGLPADSWPPDHYRLLDLEPGEANAELIEQRVHQRLDSVRRYQMMHPEQATEAMNRLAQAFVCLMDQAAKKAYDESLLGPTHRPAEPRETEEAAAEAEVLPWLSYTGLLTAQPPEPPIEEAEAPPSVPAGAPSRPPTVVSYAAAPPPPVRQAPQIPIPELPPVLKTEAVPLPDDEPSATPASPAPAPPAEPVDPVLEAALSPAARRGIGTKRTLFLRIARTRQLLRVWTSLGKYLSSPKRRLSRHRDGMDFVRKLEEVYDLLKGFPPLLGEAGRPGYLVLALTQVDTVKVFQSFSPSQREALTRDWRAGIKLLLAHRDFLRQEIHARRKRTPWQRLVRGAYSLVIDQPGTVLLLLALLALNVALWRTYAEALWARVFLR
jgi:hypothetical protein